MAVFDPSKHRDGGDGGFQALPAGPYVVAIVDFERKSSDKAGTYLRAKYKVVHGPRKGAVFYSPIMINLSRDGTAARLGALCRAVGCSKPFDLDDDRQVRASLVGRPFKAQISQSRSGQYVNNNVDRYLADMTSVEGDAAEAWRSDWLQQEQARDANGNGDDWNADDYSDDQGGQDEIPF